MKRLIFSMVLLTAAINVKAQVNEEVVQEEIISNKLYKFELRLPTQCIDKMVYQKTGKEVEHELSDDGKTVYIKNLVQGQSVKVECTYKNGSRDSFIKSPCTLELVVPI